MEFESFSSYTFKHFVKGCVQNIDKFGQPDHSLQPNYHQYQPPMHRHNAQILPCSTYQQKIPDFDAANQFAPMSYPGRNKFIRENSYRPVSYQQPTLYDRNVDAQMQGFSGPPLQQQQQDCNGSFYNSDLVQQNHQQYNNGLFSLLINKKFMNLIFNSCHTLYV